MSKRVRKRWTMVLVIIILAAGVGLLLYPTVSDKWNSYHQSRAIDSYKQAVENLSADEKAAMLEAARDYNERLAQTGVHFLLSEEERAEYESLLDVSGTGIMGYIDIPSLNVNLPIYHGVNEEVLQIAIGHLEGTSLPIGGENTHASVSGHRGLPSARLFTDLDQLEEGDIFTITVLDETITYRVDQIRIVLPEETSEMMIKQGEDYCTLITCTPYGVNTHRILVRGTRTENIADLSSIADAERIPVYLVMPAVGIPILFILLLLLLLKYRRKGPQLSGREMLEQYTKNKENAPDGPAEGKENINRE